MLAGSDKQVVAQLERVVEESLRDGVLVFPFVTPDEFLFSLTLLRGLLHQSVDWLGTPRTEA